MKSVMISIKPKWCELIASGKKTIEVRKTKPKLEPPFKCYIYETKDKSKKYYDTFHGNTIGKVIGEFVCDVILPMSVEYSNPNSKLALKEFPYTCLTDKQIIDYLGNGKDGYGWHISNLVIYDNPKELSEFCRNCNPCYGANCKFCKTHGGSRSKMLQRPPQSWCYVEVM